MEQQGSNGMSYPMAFLAESVEGRLVTPYREAFQKKSFILSDHRKLLEKQTSKCKVATSKRHFVPNLLIHCLLLKPGRSPGLCQNKVCCSPQPRLSLWSVPGALCIGQYLGKVI